jgi:hypothetical protein
MTMDSPTEARGATFSICEATGCCGLELVAMLADGSVRRPPMAETLPFTLLPPEEGLVGLLATPEPRFCNLTNTVHGGWIEPKVGSNAHGTSKGLVVSRKP